LSTFAGAGLQQWRSSRLRDGHDGLLEQLLAPAWAQLLLGALALWGLLALWALVPLVLTHRVVLFDERTGALTLRRGLRTADRATLAEVRYATGDAERGGMALIGLERDGDADGEESGRRWVVPESGWDAAAFDGLRILQSAAGLRPAPPRAAPSWGGRTVAAAAGAAIASSRPGSGCPGGRSTPPTRTRSGPSSTGCAVCSAARSRHGTATRVPDPPATHLRSIGPQRGSAQKTARRTSTTTAPMPAAAGSVMIQARKIGRISFQFAARLTIPTPSTAPIRMWVEETGRPSTEASSTTVAAASSAANPEEGCIEVSPVPTVWITLRPTNHRPETSAMPKATSAAAG